MDKDNDSNEQRPQQLPLAWTQASFLINHLGDGDSSAFIVVTLHCHGS